MFVYKTVTHTHTHSHTRSLAHTLSLCKGSGYRPFSVCYEHEPLAFANKTHTPWLCLCLRLRLRPGVWVCECVIMSGVLVLLLVCVCRSVSVSFCCLLQRAATSRNLFTLKIFLRLFRSQLAANAVPTSEMARCTRSFSHLSPSSSASPSHSALRPKSWLVTRLVYLSECVPPPSLAALLFVCAYILCCSVVLQPLFLLPPTSYRLYPPTLCSSPHPLLWLRVHLAFSPRACNTFLALIFSLDTRQQKWEMAK